MNILSLKDGSVTRSVELCQFLSQRVERLELKKWSAVPAKQKAKPVSQAGNGALCPGLTLCVA